MANFEDGSYGTAAGIALIAKVLAGRCLMHYTRVAAGKGIIPEGMTPKTMTDSADYVMDAVISGVTNPVDGECQITVQINSAEVEHGFYLTNLVLFAEDPDLGEIPYTYLSLENEPEWIRPASSIVGKLATFDIIAAVGDVDTVIATIDPEAMATIAQVQKMIAHAATKTIIDFTLHPADWQQDPAPTTKYTWYADVHNDVILASHYPDVTLDNDKSQETACDAGLCPTVQTLEDGILRFYAQAKPDADISGSCVLWGGGTGTAVSGIGSLPIASSAVLGGVKIGPGLNISDDGTLSLNTATDADVQAMFGKK